MSNNTDQALKNALNDISHKWDQDIIPVLKEYVSIPNKSPMFDKEWKKNGYMDQAMQLIIKWCKQQKIANMHFELLETPGRTPLLFIDIPGQSNDTILLYGHMDKQPEMSGWDADLGPWKAVIKDDKLYGRGAADDGYATFCALTAIETLQRLKIPHARCVVIIEACEESGSHDLPHYLEQLKPKIGTPSLVITLDSDSANYEQLWNTTSLRGILGGVLTIEVLREGLHSGVGSGVVPSTTQILQQLLARAEDMKTGEIQLKELHVQIPKQRVDQTKAAAKILGDEFFHDYPFAGNTRPISNDTVELFLNRTWRPTLSVVGINGLPPLENAGNVTIPKLAVKLSFRLPPTCQAKEVGKIIKDLFEKDPPFDAKVNFEIKDVANGWEAPPLAPWLEKSSEHASQLFFNQHAAYLGSGGTIPFMGMLGKMFPDAQFLITGVLGPKSNAHGPNEFLHIPLVKKLTGCVATIIADHFNREKK